MVLETRPWEQGVYSLLSTVIIVASGMEGHSKVALAWWENWLESLPPNTRHVYAWGLERFARYCRLSQGKALFLILTPKEEDGRALFREYLGYLTDQGFRAASINAALAPLRRVVGLARERGLLSWQLDTPNLDARSQRPGSISDLTFARLLQAAERPSDRYRTRRDQVLLWLLRMGWTVHSVTALPLRSVQVKKERVWTPKRSARIPEEATRVFGQWVRLRKVLNPENPWLLIALDEIRPGSLSTSAVQKVFRITIERTELPHITPKHVKKKRAF